MVVLTQVVDHLISQSTLFLSTFKQVDNLFLLKWVDCFKFVSFKLNGLNQILLVLVTFNQILRDWSSKQLDFPPNNLKVNNYISLTRVKQTKNQTLYFIYSNVQKTQYLHFFIMNKRKCVSIFLMQNVFDLCIKNNKNILHNSK